MTNPLQRRWAGACLALAASCVAGAAEVETAVWSALDEASRVRVVVLLTASEEARDEDRRRSIRRAADDVLAALPSVGYRLRHRFERVAALALEVDREALARLASHDGVRRIGIDVGGTGAMAESAPLARVSDTLAAGLDGAGAKIAVIDSGVDTDHPDFAGRLVAQHCFCAGVAGAVGCCPNGADTMSGAGSAEDDHGHGTNVTGIAAGGGAVAVRGAAPAASIVAVKVLDSNNSFCCASDVVAALDWVRQNHPDTSVVNASLGTSMLFSTTCDNAAAFTQTMSVAVANLAQNGTLVFASSGNNRSATAISAPACLDRVVAVGAVWDSVRGPTTALGCTESTTVDQATCFTNSNALVDLYAPGAPVTSSGRNGGTSTFFGTSQAAPLAAGCATSLRAELSSATPAQLRAALQASPSLVVDSKNGRSFPRLDCADAAARLLLGTIFSNGFEG